MRGAGLFVGVELRHGGPTGAPATAEAARIVNLLRERHVLISSAGLHANVLKIRPPLVFRTEHAEMLAEALDQALAECKCDVGEVKGCAPYAPADGRLAAAMATIRDSRRPIREDALLNNERTCRISSSSICAGGQRRTGKMVLRT